MGRSMLRPGLPEPQASVSVGGREYACTRARLGAFILLQMAKGRLEEAARAQDTGGAADALFLFLSAGLDLPRDLFEAAPWQDIARAFRTVDQVNLIPDRERLALLRYAEVGRAPPWDYPGREVVVWVNSLARFYGWTKDEVLDLYPEEAVALLQEAIAGQYYERRFSHALSEVAYRVDKSGHATYQPLPPPLWMVARDRPAFIVEAPLRPVGLIKFPPGHQPKDIVQ